MRSDQPSAFRVNTLQTFGKDDLKIVQSNRELTAVWSMPVTIRKPVHLIDYQTYIKYPPPQLPPVVDFTGNPGAARLSPH